MAYTLEDFAEIEEKWIIMGRPRCEHTGRWECLAGASTDEEGCTACGIIRRAGEAVEVRGVWS